MGGILIKTGHLAFTCSPAGGFVWRIGAREIKKSFLLSPGCSVVTMMPRLTVISLTSQVCKM